LFSKNSSFVTPISLIFTITIKINESLIFLF